MSHTCVICNGNGKKIVDTDKRIYKNCVKNDVKDCDMCGALLCHHNPHKGVCPACKGAGNFPSGDPHFVEGDNWGEHPFSWCFTDEKNLRDVINSILIECYLDDKEAIAESRLNELVTAAQALRIGEKLEIHPDTDHVIARIELTSQEIKALPEFQGW